MKTTIMFPFFSLVPVALFAAGRPVFDPDEYRTDESAAAIRVALEAASEIPFPTWRISVEPKINGSNTTVSISSHSPLGFKKLAEVAIEDNSGRLLPVLKSSQEESAEIVSPAEPHGSSIPLEIRLSDDDIKQLVGVFGAKAFGGDGSGGVCSEGSANPATNPGMEQSDRQTIQMAIEGLHGIPMWGLSAVVANRRDGIACISISKATDIDNKPLAMIAIDEKSGRLIPDATQTILSDDEAVRLAKGSRHGAKPAPGQPFLVDHISGITVVGFPSRPRASSAIVFSPTVWIHDESRTVIASIEEPN